MHRTRFGTRRFTLLPRSPQPIAKPVRGSPSVRARLVNHNATTYSKVSSRGCPRSLHSRFWADATRRVTIINRLNQYWMRLNNPSFPRLRHSRAYVIPTLPSFPRFRHSRASVIPALPSFPRFRHSRLPSFRRFNHSLLPSFPRKRESRNVGCWRTQLYETSSVQHPWAR